MAEEGDKSSSKRKFGSGERHGSNDMEAAKQRAEQIAARIVSQDIKRARSDENVEERSGHSFSKGADPENTKGHTFLEQRHVQQQLQQEDNIYCGQQESYTDMQGFPESQKIDVPNNKVGVIIGKGGETIKYIQQQSGARIQVTRDADYDPNAQTRQVELMGTPGQIGRAKLLIDDVVAEAAAGGSGALITRGFGGLGIPGEQVQITVPSNKVGIIIGKGGENIKNLQNRSGARIQFAEAEPGAGKRGVILIGNKRQTDIARELVNEVVSMSENRFRGPPMSGGYRQVHRPPGPPQWASLGAQPLQQQGYGYQQQGVFPGQSQQYHGGQPRYSGPQKPYSGHPPQHTSTGFTSGWDQQSVGESGWDQQPHGPSGWDQKPPGHSQQQHNQDGSYGSYSQSESGASSLGYGPAQGGQHLQQPYAQGYGQNTTQQLYVQQAPDQDYGQQGHGESQSYVHTRSKERIPSEGQLSYASYTEQSYNQQSGYTQEGFPQQAHSKQGITQTGYDQQRSAQGVRAEAQFQPGYGKQADSKAGGYDQQTSMFCGYEQQGTTPSDYVQHGYMQENFGQKGPVQSGYGQQPPSGYIQQGSSVSSYEQQVASQPGNVQQTPLQQISKQQGSFSSDYSQGPQPVHGHQSSAQSTYGLPGSSQSAYGQPLPVQSSYGQQGPSQMCGPPGSNQQGYTQGSANNYGGF